MIYKAGQMNFLFMYVVAYYIRLLFHRSLNATSHFNCFPGRALKIKKQKSEKKLLINKLIRKFNPSRVRFYIPLNLIE